jgi:hypothetical protein
MINNAEHQETFIQHLRWLADGQIDDASEAVRSYHGHLGKLGIRPYRSLEDDLQRSVRASAYGATPKVINTPSIEGTASSCAAGSAGGTEEPDSSTMTQAENIALDESR